MKLVERLAAAGDLPALNLLGSDDLDGATDAARTLVATLYDQKQKHQQLHGDLNSMRAQLATDRDVALTKLPPAEASFTQHISRASFQTRIWTSSHVAEPVTPSPINHGWTREDGVLVPLFFEGNTAAEILDGLLCTCRGKSPCAETCSCTMSNMGCTEQCMCSATDRCHNKFTDLAKEADTD